MSDSEARTLFFEALALLDAANFAEAERKLRAAQALAPDNEAVLTNLSVVLLAQGKPTEACHCAEQALALNAANIEALLVLADCHTHGDNLHAALDAYDRVIALEPAIAAAHNNRALILDRLGRYADALEACDRALALQSDLADAHVNRGNVLQHLAKHEDALATYDAALALSPDLAEAWLGRGNALTDLKRPDEALSAFDRVPAESPAAPHASLGRGNVFYRRKEWKAALKACETALAYNPDFAEAWLGLGNALCELRRHNDALAAYDKALALAPALAGAWLGRGNVFDDLKRYDSALASYDKAIATSAEYTAAWLGRGNALRTLKRAPEAIDAYRQALKLGGDADSIGYCLAGLGAGAQPSAPPQHYVASLFDSYAENFDKDLTGNLKYRVPLVLTEAMQRLAPARSLDILDLGCGTGLVGEQVRTFKRSLTGVDLSANMLDKAAHRQVYDYLVCSDLGGFLQSQADEAFDLAIAADVFVYVGDLSAIFSDVRRTLRAQGLFGFSVEGIAEGDFVLRSTLRYAHSLDYLRGLAQQHGFKIETMMPHVIRRDAGADIDGYLMIMRNSMRDH